MSEQAAATKSLARIWQILATPLSAIGIVNIVGKIGDLRDISTSLSFLVAWWRYIVSAVFGWLHLHWPPVVQDAVALTMIAVAVTNTQIMVEERTTLYNLTVRFIHKNILDMNVPDGASFSSDLLDQRWLVVFLGLTTIAFALALFAISPFALLLLLYPLLPLGLFCSLGIFVLWQMSDVVTPSLPALRIVTAVLAIPVVGWLYIVAMMAHCRRWIGATIGLALMILCLNWVFLHVGDPLLAVLSHLPPPPRA